MIFRVTIVPSGRPLPCAPSRQCHCHSGDTRRMERVGDRCSVIELPASRFADSRRPDHCKVSAAHEGLLPKRCVYHPATMVSRSIENSPRCQARCAARRRARLTRWGSYPLAPPLRLLGLASRPPSGVGSNFLARRRWDTPAREARGLQTQQATRPRPFSTAVRRRRVALCTHRLDRPACRFPSGWAMIGKRVTERRTTRIDVRRCRPARARGAAVSSQATASSVARAGDRRGGGSRIASKRLPVMARAKLS